MPRPMIAYQTAQSGHDMKRLGLILRAGSGGLSTISRDFAKHYPDAKKLVIDTGMKGDLCDGSRFPDATVHKGMRMQSQLIEQWLNGIDTLLTFETPYTWELFDICRKRGIKTILCAMYEYLNPFDIKAHPVDLIWQPVRWYMEAMRAWGIPVAFVPMPVDREVFKFKQHKQAAVGLINLGHWNIDEDRNGTGTILAALPLIRSRNLRLIIHSQHPFECDDPRVTVISGDVPHPIDNYAAGDFLIYPRRYAGLSLPMNEALSCGLPVLMTDMKPQNRILPRHWLIPVSNIRQWKLRNVIDLATINPLALAQKIDAWVNRDIARDSELAGEIAESFSWPVVKPALDAMIELPAAEFIRTEWFQHPFKKQEKKRIVFVGNFAGTYYTEQHVKRGLEGLGHEVIPLQEQTALPETILQAAQNSDLVLSMKTHGIRDGQIKARDLNAALKARGVKTASVNMDLWVGLRREKSISMDDPYWSCDVAFQADAGGCAALKRRGANAVGWKPGIVADEAYPGRYRPELASDVAFVGSDPRAYHAEWPFRARMLAFLEKTYGPRFRHWGKAPNLINNGPVRDQNLNDVYASVKVVIGDSIYAPDYWSDRLYETIGRGGFIIFPMIPGLQSHVGNIPLVTYHNDEGRRTNFDSLKTRIDYYIEHDAERESIRRACFESIRRRHNYCERGRAIIDTIFSAAPAAISTRATIGAPSRLNLGCGHSIRPGADWLNVDGRKTAECVQVVDLNVTPWPWPDGSFDEVQAIDIIEHLDNPVAFINEIIRISRRGASITIQGPDARHPDHTWTDLSHKRGLMPRNLEYWIRGSDLGRAYGHGLHGGKYGLASVRVIEKNFNLIFEAIRE